MHSAQMFTNVVERNELPLYDAGFIFSKKCALYYTMKFFSFVQSMVTLFLAITCMKDG